VSRRRKNNYWIQEAIENPGSFREWVLRNRKRIKRLTGLDPIKRDGTISVTAIRKLRQTRWYRERLSATTKRRINLFLTLNRLRKD